MYWGYLEISSVQGMAIVVCLLMTGASTQETLSNILLPRQFQVRKLHIFPSSDSLNIELPTESNDPRLETRQLYSTGQRQPTKDTLSPQRHSASESVAELGSVSRRYSQGSNPLFDPSLQRQLRNGSIALTTLEQQSQNASQGRYVRDVQQHSGTIPTGENRQLKKKAVDKRLGNSPARQSSEVFRIESKPGQVFTISVKAGQQIELDTQLGLTIDLMRTNVQETKSSAQTGRPSSDQRNASEHGWRISIHKTLARTKATQAAQSSVISPKESQTTQAPSQWDQGTEISSNGGRTYDMAYQSDPATDIWPYWTGFGWFG